MGLTPRSLAHERAIEQPAPGVEESWLRRTLLTIGGFYSRESRLIRGAKVLYNDITEQATNKEFYKGVSMLLTTHVGNAVLLDSPITRPLPYVKLWLRTSVSSVAA